MEWSYFMRIQLVCLMLTIGASSPSAMADPLSRLNASATGRYSGEYSSGHDLHCSYWMDDNHEGFSRRVESARNPTSRFALVDIEAKDALTLSPPVGQLSTQASCCRWKSSYPNGRAMASDGIGILTAIKHVSTDRKTGRLAAFVAACWQLLAGGI